jgi:hypothetical protein
VLFYWHCAAYVPLLPFSLFIRDRLFDLAYLFWDIYINAFLCYINTLFTLFFTTPKNLPVAGMCFYLLLVKYAPYWQPSLKLKLPAAQVFYTLRLRNWRRVYLMAPYL